MRRFTAVKTWLTSFGINDPDVSAGSVDNMVRIPIKIVFREIELSAQRIEHEKSAGTRKTGHPQAKRTGYSSSKTERL